MATIGRGMFSLLRTTARFPLSQKTCRTLVRHKTTTETGSMLPAPFAMKFGLSKVIVVTLPFLYIGATISKEGAAFLEEYDIFVPEDDD